jgi:hypothetical protein
MKSQNTVDSKDAWPDLDVSKWAGTKRTLHLYAQMLGKIRLALSPPQPNWMFTPLYFTARGVTTGFIPYGQISVEAKLDVYDSQISVERSTGRGTAVALLPVRTIADVYDDLSAALRTIDVGCYISPIPQELPDRTPFNEDRRPSDYDPAAVQRWFRAATAIAAEFDRWRSCFFGRSGVQLWWGAFDVAMLLFSGRRLSPPTDRGYLMKYDLDAELMNVGLYFGDEQHAPFFYGYIFPEPPNAEALPVAPGQAAWSTQLREWVLPYEAVRGSGDPGGAIRAFADSIYSLCFSAGGWNREALTYKAPVGSVVEKQ